MSLNGSTMWKKTGEQTQKSMSEQNRCLVLGTWRKQVADRTEKGGCRGFGLSSLVANTPVS